MLAVVCKHTDDLSGIVLEEVPDPTPGANQVVVDVHAASVEFVDTLIATGKYQIRVPAPFTPGNNLAGVVSAVGEHVEGLSVGDRVHGMGFVGAFAQKAVVAATQLRLTPPELSAELAALAGTTYRTAFDSLVAPSSGNLQPGETVVILGASGAVGAAAITVAKALSAKVIACASSAEKLDFCKGLGADEVINYAEGDFKAALKQAAPNGVDIVIDPVGGDYAEPALRAVGYGGRYVVVGFASGTIPKFPANLVLLKGSSITGYEIGSFSRIEADVAAQNIARLEAMLADGSLTPPITARFELNDAVSAIHYVAGRNKFGMTILEVSSPV